MSNLSKAPLIEVIFEIRWGMKSKEQLAKYQYLVGDLYSLVKIKYPFRESVNPPEFPIEFLINAPVHRFRTEAEKYPLIQIGPGLLTLNTINENYVWEQYELEAFELTKNFLSVSEFDKSENLTLALHYFDFIKFDFQNSDVEQFLKENLNLQIQQYFFKNNNNPNYINVNFNYNTELGSFSVSINRGQNKGNEGILIQTSITKLGLFPNQNDIREWLNNSHEFCSSIFKDMTQGNLYNTFK